MADQEDKTTSEELAGFGRMFRAMFGSEVKTQRRGSDDDYRQMMADLISNDASPFVPEDMYALQEMSSETLKELRDKYLSAPTTNQAEGGPDMAEDEDKAVKPLTEEGVAAIVANAIKDALPTVVATAVDEALNANKRTEIIEEIHEALKIDKDELTKLSTNSLEAMRPKQVSKPKADMSGRGFKQNSEDGQVTKFPSMASGGVVVETQKEA